MKIFFSILANNDDVIFNGSGSILRPSNFSTCFDVVIVDDKDIEYNEGYFFYLQPNGFLGIDNGYYNGDHTTIMVQDNEGISLNYFVIIHL